MNEINEYTERQLAGIFIKTAGIINEEYGLDIIMFRFQLAGYVL